MPNESLSNCHYGKQELSAKPETQWMAIALCIGCVYTLSIPCYSVIPHILPNSIRMVICNVTWLYSNVGPFCWTQSHRWFQDNFPGSWTLHGVKEVYTQSQSYRLQHIQEMIVRIRLANYCTYPGLKSFFFYVGKNVSINGRYRTPANQLPLKRERRNVACNETQQ